MGRTRPEILSVRLFIGTFSVAEMAIVESRMVRFKGSKDRFGRLQVVSISAGTSEVPADIDALSECPKEV